MVANQNDTAADEAADGASTDIIQESPKKSDCGCGCGGKCGKNKKRLKIVAVVATVLLLIGAGLYFSKKSN